MTVPPVLEARVRALFSSVDQQTQAVAEASGIRCPPGCGTCCDNPSVEARVTEMMPAALRLVREGRAEQVHEALERALENKGVCVFFERHALPPGGNPERTYGRCGAYADRPTLCRLFGFAGFRDKRGAPALAACWVHHDSQPNVMDRAHDLVAQGSLRLPVFVDVATQVESQEGGRFAAPMPINRALKEALERAWLMTRSTEPPP